ncbi:hypothetical protein FA95DRAFT_1561717 [Auriscalpium vulgare]|uniref:Uncharacterized protein n=1 Tax=Auriscalpium vulgare TaxID=40419 RepID=A0ACB8RMN4_9AGAM|nr:hypothetical protein FA95DRAFT_1561717 [Auriscalpium vulgare]
MAIAPYYHRSAAHSPPHPMHAYASPPPPVHAPEPEPEPVRIREKRHSCAMCHKSFDRPSTLRKHLLVHTGEKAFACDTCGRRFGVASNLNRHVRRCILRPVHARGSVTPATPDERAPSAESSPTMASSASPPASSPEASTVSSSSRARASPVEPHAARPKRRRRAPSPARWVPPSLVEFDLSLYKKSCPVPLAPEAEHDWDTCEEQVPFNPYHPDGWKGRLPGPGRDIINTSMTVGRLVLY